MQDILFVNRIKTKTSAEALLFPILKVNYLF